MAKKRKLAQNSIPTSNPEPEPEPEPETQSEPEPEPIEEDQPPIKEEEEEEEEEANEEEKDDDDGGEEEEEVEEGEEGEDEDQKPQPLEKTISTLDPAAAAASNGSADADDDQEESDPEAIQKILELFPKDQLVELLRDAAVKHADLRNEVHRIADVDPAHRKIFVHGLGWDTNAKILTEVFSQFGEIEDCNAVTDKATGRSKGYGFILFKHRKGAQNALKEPQKKIGGRMTACQLASAGPGPGSVQPPAPPVSEYTQRKIFVSNVGADVDPKKLLEFFAKFGEIEEGPLGLDKATGKPRGFCLFVYNSAESVKKALEEPHKNFEGRVLHCQKAIDGPKAKYQYQYQHAAGAQYPGTANGPKGNFSGGVGHVPAAGGHLMAPSATGQGYNPAVAAAGPATGAVPGLNPALNQALTAILLGGLGSAAGGPMVNQGVPGQMGNSGMQGGYGGGQMGGLAGYGGQAPAQGGYGGAQMGQGGSVRGQQGYGHAGGGPPYMGHH